LDSGFLDEFNPLLVEVGFGHYASKIALNSYKQEIYTGRKG